MIVVHYIAYVEFLHYLTLDTLVFSVAEQAKAAISLRMTWDVGITVIDGVGFQIDRFTLKNSNQDLTYILYEVVNYNYQELCKTWTE